jgi:elongation factor Ts
MAEVTAAMVKALREETSQGMMECRKALVESNGDIQLAKDILRKRGMVTAEKKASRTASEGLVAILSAGDRKSAAMVEIRCETDFCARNDVFRAMAANVVKMALDGPDGQVHASQPIKDQVQSALAKIGENMNFARGIKISAPKIGAYLHHNNKVGVLVGIEGEIDDTILNDICMHVAFTDPMGLTVNDIPSDLVEHEKRLAREQAMEAGKPPEIAEKMTTGKVRKFLEANALLEQPFVKDDKKKVKEILGAAKITAFARYQVGQTN